MTNREIANAVIAKLSGWDVRMWPDRLGEGWAVIRPGGSWPWGVYPSERDAWLAAYSMHLMGEAKRMRAQP